MEAAVVGFATAGMWIAAGVLVAAGVAKLRRPTGTASALHLVRLPASTALARVLGAGEVVIGLTALLVGGRWAAATVAGAYAAFTLVSARGRTRPEAPCGCFGDSTAPLTTTHVVVNAVLAVTVTVAAVVAAPGVAAATADSPALLLAAAVAIGTAAALVAATLTTVPVLARQLTPASEKQ